MWVINGSLDSYQSEQHTARVNRISVETLELLLEKQYQHDFNEKMSDDKEEMSREDAMEFFLRFMEIMENVYGHHGEVCELQRWTLQFEIAFQGQ